MSQEPLLNLDGSTVFLHGSVVYGCGQVLDTIEKFFVHRHFLMEMVPDPDFKST